MTEYLKVGEVADRIGLGRDTIYVMHSRGQLPDPDMILDPDKDRPLPLWKPATVDRWNETRRKRSRTCPTCGDAIYYGLFCSNDCADRTST